MIKPAKVIVGTSGWQYKDWNGRFYPEDITGKAQLPYFAKHFKSVEINTTFYHTPRLSSIETWAKSVPADFGFVIKLNRFLTHTKRMTSDEQFTDYLHDFLDLLKPLRRKLSAILVQLPPSMKVENSRLEYFAEAIIVAEKRLKMRLPIAMEFRHGSWFNEETFSLMRKYDMANVINDSPKRWPASREVTATFVYIRFHGSKRLYRSSYSREELEKWAEFINKHCVSCSHVFCYFNNDYNGVAVRNAKTLQQIISNKRT